LAKKSSWWNHKKTHQVEILPIMASYNDEFNSSGLLIEFKNLKNKESKCLKVN